MPDAPLVGVDDNHICWIINYYPEIYIKFNTANICGLNHCNAKTAGDSSGFRIFSVRNEGYIGDKHISLQSISQISNTC